MQIKKDTSASQLHCNTQRVQLTGPSAVAAAATHTNDTPTTLNVPTTAVAAAADLLTRATAEDTAAVGLVRGTAPLAATLEGVGAATIWTDVKVSTPTPTSPPTL